MSLMQRAVKGIAWSATQHWGTQLASFLVFLVLSRLLDPKDFGLVALASVFVAFAQVFLDQGFSDAIIQKASVDREDLDTTFWTGLSMAIVLALGSAALSGPLASVMGEPELGPIIACLSLAFPLAALGSTQQAVLKRALAFKVLAIRSLVSVVLGGAVGISLAFAGAGAWSLVGQNLVTTLIATLILWRLTAWSPGLRFSAGRFRELFGFGRSVLGTKILQFASRRSDSFLIGYFLGSTELGYFTVAYRLVLTMIRLITTVLNAVAFPTFSRIHGDPERSRKAFYRATRYASFVAFPAFFGASVIAPELLPTLFGAKWEPSVPVMQVLALAGAINSIAFFNGTILTASGKPSWRMRIVFVQALCGILAFFMVYRFGLTAVAAAHAVVAFAIAPVTLLAVRALIRIDLSTYLGNLIQTLAASAIMIGALLGARHLIGQASIPASLGLGLLISVGVLTYVAAIWLLDGRTSREIVDLVGRGLARSRPRET
jgi:PST family polysaccharide transporter